MLIKIKVGDLVRFKYGKVPKTFQGKALMQNRPQNRLEEGAWGLAVSHLEWDDLFCTDYVFKISKDFVMVGDARDGGLVVPKADIVEVVE